MALTLLILGANSALPTFERFSSSFVLSHNNGKFLIDAGEGCQIKLGQYKVKRSKLSDVFISHLHGDHVFGLPGLITSLNLNDRRIPLTIWGPVGIKKFLKTVVDVSGVHLRFPLTINEMEHTGDQIIATFSGMEVFAFPLRHRIQTYGYLFRETGIQKNIKSEMIEKYGLTTEEIITVKQGGDIQRGEEILQN